MSLTNRKMIVFDFETDGLKIDTGQDNITQIGAIAVDLRTLELDTENKFEVWICPDELRDAADNDKIDEYISKHSGALEKHAEWRGEESPKDYVNFLLENGIEPKKGLKAFCAFCKDHKTAKGPVPAGQNIVNFDIPGLKYACEKHKVGYPFPQRADVFDLWHLSGYWFLYAENPPKSWSMANVRKHFGMSDDNAHDAIQDVIDTGTLICKYLKLHQTFVKKVKAVNNGVGS